MCIAKKNKPQHLVAEVDFEFYERNKAIIPQYAIDLLTPAREPVEEAKLLQEA